MKRKYQTEFSQKARQAIRNRDKGCIFCQMGYKTSDESFGDLQIMHYIGRGRGGLGIPENGALGCAYHHQMMDNGLYGPEMREMFKEYLMEQYKGWNEGDLVYDKWAFLKSA